MRKQASGASISLCGGLHHLRKERLRPRPATRSTIADASGSRAEIETIVSAHADDVAARTRLRRHYTTATLSNAGTAAVVAVVKHAGLPFDAILTAELVRTYKPAPAAYQPAVDFPGYCRIRY